MRERLLNRTVKILRKDLSETGLSDSGDILLDEEQEIATGVKIRITKNVVYQPQEKKEDTGWMSSSFLGFTLTGVDVQMNDVLEDESSGQRYLVAWVDKIPGGAPDSHYEIYMNESKGDG